MASLKSHFLKNSEHSLLKLCWRASKRCWIRHRKFHGDVFSRLYVIEKFAGEGGGGVYSTLANGGLNVGLIFSSKEDGEVGGLCVRVF